jgi:hypothetical protein
MPGREKEIKKRQNSCLVKVFLGPFFFFSVQDDKE